MRRRILCLLLLLASAQFASAQQMMHRLGKTGVAIEAIRPVYDYADASVLSAAYYLSGHHQLNDRIMLIAELPFGYYAEETGMSFGNSSGGLGNPYLGMQVHSGIFTFDAGVRVPTLSSSPDAIEFATFSDIQRFEAFLPDLFALHGGFAVQSTPRNGMTYGANLSPALVVRTRSGIDHPTDVYLDYGANVGYVATQVRATVRFDGMGILTRDNLTFARATMHQAALTADFGAGRYRPGFYVALPVDRDMTDFLDTIVGVTFQVALR